MDCFNNPFHFYKSLVGFEEIMRHMPQLVQKYDEIFRDFGIMQV